MFDMTVDGVRMAWSISIGADPELFLQDASSGEVLPSEVLLPENGLDLSTKWENQSIKRDGVQIELHPAPSDCRAYVGVSIAQLMIGLSQAIEQSERPIKVNFDQGIELSPKNMSEFSPRILRLGCNPSRNVYRAPRMSVDGRRYPLRFAGGHLHFGSLVNAERDRIAQAVKMLDLVVGNLSVILDRNPWAVERRTMYGRAGEYRIQPWGFEYRTLTNFWLRNYRLMSLVAGLSRMAISLSCESDKAKLLFDAVPTEHVVHAIQQSDLAAAWENWIKVQKVLDSMPQIVSEAEGYTPGWTKPFNKVLEQGIDYWFPDDPMESWTSLVEGHGNGWENFLFRAQESGMVYNEEELAWR